ncbi:TRAP transporter small permease [Brachybacterium sp. AOP29-B2-41]|uniref:TRAP transporter small permease n=1 Tax=Brachybacterium sp. AOP29-B2-41 TaxID=3457704 RepID=UPI00403491DA
MSRTSPTVGGAIERDPVITEEDLASLDTSDGHSDDAQPEEPINRVTAQIGGWIAIISTLLIVALVTLAVIMRYFLNSSLAIAAEGPTYLFPWLIAGGAIVAQGSRGHIAVDVLVSRLTGKAFERAQIAIWAFSTLLLAYLTYLAVYLIPPMAAQSTPIMGWPQLGSFSAFIVMVAVMAIQAGARTVHYFRHGIPDEVIATVPSGSPDAPSAQDDASTQDSPKETPGA